MESSRNVARRGRRPSRRQDGVDVNIGKRPVDLHHMRQIQLPPRVERGNVAGNIKVSDQTSSDDNDESDSVSVSSNELPPVPRSRRISELFEMDQVVPGNEHQQPREEQQRLNEPQQHHEAENVEGPRQLEDQQHLDEPQQHHEAENVERPRQLGDQQHLDEPQQQKGDENNGPQLMENQQCLNDLQQGAGENQQPVD
ncbi:hypothetical protein QAD02_004039 [Eretmocerus hayati]|uniref:Uncharacterized protein n=1 Tax=Eretmocerus hayati TaxID=131215 RepID=A0ACC2NNW9_9HYME|nr:hypothetical protein QAD02_004039 [Eretmocerus hayati]